jgi:hypothetical protein
MHHLPVLLRCFKSGANCPLKEGEQCFHVFTVFVTVSQYTQFFLHMKLYTLKEL